jgi:thrombospondin type 3 repeat protein
MRRDRLLLTLLAAVAASLAQASPAAAVDCSAQPLKDEPGVTWNTNGYLSLDTTTPGVNYMSPYFDRSYSVYFYNPGDDCTFEDGDRELRYPAKMVGDLEVSGTVYVPSGAPAFARTLTILHNPHPEPSALTPAAYFETDYTTNTQIAATSNGDAVGTAADDWLTVRDSSDLSHQRIGFVWNFGAAADRRTSVTEVYEYDDGLDYSAGPYTGDDPTVTGQFGRIVVPPGGTVALLWISLTRPDDAGAEAAARELQAAPDALLAGLSDDEKRLLLNVGLPDGDLDGRPNSGDNCRFDVNPDQANLDGDALGDACDDDIDGDGVGNAAETLRGTDPRKADSDGDGRRDDVDTCNAKAGSGADGCPRTDEPPATPDITKPGVVISGLKGTMKRRAFFRGVPCVVELTEAAAVTCRLVARASRVARIAKAGELELASRSLPLGTGRRSARLKPKRGLIRQRRFRATLQVTATDAAGNATTKTKRFRVR